MHATRDASLALWVHNIVAHLETAEAYYTSDPRRTKTVIVQSHSCLGYYAVKIRQLIYNTLSVLKQNDPSSHE